MKGEPCVIQAKNSQVKLHFPRGVHGVVLGSIHTIHSKFLHLIPDSVCVVGPMCEYSVHTFINGPQVASFEKFLLQVPHLGREVQNAIRVRHMDNVAREVTLIRTQDKMDPQLADVSFDIDEQYVHIFTSHFIPFIVSAEAMNCCA